MKPHEEWLTKAEHDLSAAKVLIDSDNELSDVAIYHTQQCGEKALKAYLAFLDFEIEKTHNLKVLLEKCRTSDKSFETLIYDANFINPYSTAFRYPDSGEIPDNETVLEAINSAEKILNFVKDKIKA